jgi:hypothetical protein
MTDNNTSSVVNAANVSNVATPHEQPKLLPFQKTKEQRATDVKPIIHKLNELQLNMSYEPIRKMYKVINEYIKEGESRKINIAFPEVKRRIKGFLSDDTRKETWMKLEADD